MPMKKNTSETTKNNSRLLAESFEDGVSFEEIDITQGVHQQLKDIGQDSEIENTVSENAQARYRTMLLFQRANEISGLVVGTGDLSEIALGWCTYNGDHMSHYNVNCSVPKTLIRNIVEWYKENIDWNDRLKKVLEEILKAPYSPELTNKKGLQKTEDLIGPYELHDFFLYHFIRWGSSLQKIFFLAEKAWSHKYSKSEIKKWLRVFIARFFANQWKRSVATDGPKVGSVSLSPRGDWRMPSDADAQLWLDELDQIQL
jgi:NAD+ synthase (glutamine-hydrolysing)